MDKFADQLAALIQRATKGPWCTERRSFGYPKREGGPVVKILDIRAANGVPICAGTIADATDENMELIALLANHAEAIEKVVRAAYSAHKTLADEGHHAKALRLGNALNELEGKG